VFITQGYPPERVGGVEVYLKGLATELAREHEVYVFSRGLKAGLRHGETYETLQDKVRVTRLFVDMRALSSFRDIYLRPWVDNLFREYLKKVRPHVVHVQHLGGLSLGMISEAADQGIKVVYTLSDHQPFCPRGQRIRNDKRVCKTINLDECQECLMPQTVGMPSRASKLVAYLLAKERGKDFLRRMHEDIEREFENVERFITPSRFHCERMVEAGVPGERTEVLPYGMDLSMLDRVPERPAGEPARRFGYLGTLIPSKGVEDVIMAFKRMKVPGCSLHVYGEAVPYHGMTDYDKRLVEMARSEDISFYGPYQPEDLVKVLSKIDVLVMPSRWYESYGITIREAFRAKRPVLASDIGAFSEAIEHGKNGLKFAPGDVHDLAEKMDQLAGDAELAHNLTRSESPVESIPDHAQKLIRIYKDDGGEL